MGLSVRKNLGGLTGKEDNIQEEPTIFRTKPLLQTKITEEKEVGKRKHNVGESEPVSKRRKTEEKKEVEEAPKMVRLTMASLRPNMNMFKMYNVKATPEAPAVKKEQNFSKIKREKVPVFGMSSQIETIILF